MQKTTYQIFQEECPELFDSFNKLVETQRDLPGLEPKTKQLINIAIQTSNHNVRGVQMHASMAQKMGAEWDEVKGAVVMNLHLSGLSCVLECLPAALEGFQTEDDF